MKRKKKLRPFICQNHDDIIITALEIIELDIPPGLRREIRSRARHIIKEAKAAKSAGEAMESRLLEYRYSIEGLGFDRIK